MTRLRHVFAALRRKWALTPELAETLSTVKFPCC
jgi:hypothetical protein